MMKILPEIRIGLNVGALVIMVMALLLVEDYSRWFTQVLLGGLIVDTMGHIIVSVRELE